MRYDLSDEYGRKMAETRWRYLMAKGLHGQVIVELTDKTVRSLDQNAYLHVLLGCLAMHVGLPLRETKEEIYKAVVNPDLYVRERDVPGVGKVRVLLSSRDLSVEDMSKSIDRLRNFASMELGCYLPSSDERSLLRSIELEMDRHSQYL